MVHSVIMMIEKGGKWERIERLRIKVVFGVFVLVVHSPLWNIRIQEFWTLSDFSEGPAQIGFGYIGAFDLSTRLYADFKNEPAR